MPVLRSLEGGDTPLIVIQNKQVLSSFYYRLLGHFRSLGESAPGIPLAQLCCATISYAPVMGIDADVAMRNAEQLLRISNSPSVHSIRTLTLAIEKPLPTMPDEVVAALPFAAFTVRLWASGSYLRDAFINRAACALLGYDSSEKMREVLVRLKVVFLLMHSAPSSWFTLVSTLSHSYVSMSSASCSLTMRKCDGQCFEATFSLYPSVVDRVVTNMTAFIIPSSAFAPPALLSSMLEDSVDIFDNFRVRRGAGVLGGVGGEVAGSAALDTGGTDGATAWRLPERNGGDIEAGAAPRPLPAESPLPVAARFGAELALPTLSGSTLRFGRSDGELPSEVAAVEDPAAVQSELPDVQDVASMFLT